MRKIELVAPAGNREKFDIALANGADAVFVGGRMLNMRAGTTNFSDDEIEELVTKVHKKGKKLYVTLNAVPHNEEIEELPSYIQFLENIGVDGVVISDMGVFQCVKENSKLKITVNTHSSNTNWRSVKMWKDMGATRVILDRDITLSSIAEIRAKVPDVELEVFVHGPFCMAISGRKILSNYMDSRELTKDPTDEHYSIVEETRPGEYMPVYEDRYGTYIFSARDLNTLDIIEKILDLGINAIKIDGGMKSNEYLEAAVSVYNEVLDSYLSGEYTVKNEWKTRLESVSKNSFIEWFSE